RFDGPADAGQGAAAEALSAHHGLNLLLADLSHPAAQALDPALLAQILAREAVMQQAGLFIDASGTSPGVKEAGRIAAALGGLCAPGRLLLAALGREGGPLPIGPAV